MSQLLQSAVLDGILGVVNGTGVPTHYENGLPFDDLGGGITGLAVDNVGAISHYHMGLPFTAQGRMATIDDDVVRFGGGATPFSSQGRIAVNNSVNIHAVGGVQFTVGSCVAAIGLADTGWSPADLFASGEKGGYYDISDISTLWKDIEGTAPITVDGEEVLRIDDLSGNNNHLFRYKSTEPMQYKTFGGVSWLESVVGIANGVVRYLRQNVMPIQVPFTSVIGAGVTAISTGSTSYYYAGLIKGEAANTNFMTPARRGDTSRSALFIRGANMTPSVGQKVVSGGANDMPLNVPKSLLSEFTSGLMSLMSGDVELIPPSAHGWTNETATDGSLAIYMGDDSMRLHSFVAIDRVLTAQEKADVYSWTLDRLT